jgi:hypothetical protein
MPAAGSGTPSLQSPCSAGHEQTAAVAAFVHVKNGG